MKYLYTKDEHDVYLNDSGPHIIEDKKMTPRELRKVLFQVEDQKISVSELRAILYNIQDQDIELTDRNLRRLTNEKK